MATKISEGLINRQILIVEDQKATTTDGGGSTAGSWQDRTLNTSVVNNIAGASLGSNQVTLPAGTYEVTGFSVSFRTGATQSRLRDSGDTTTYAISSANYGDTSDGDNILNTFNGYFTLGSSTTLDLQTKAAQAKATDGFGRASDGGEVEIFSSLKFIKVS